MVDVFRQELIERLRKFIVENRHEVLKSCLHAFGENFLRLHAERGNVPIGFQEMQKLAAVGHPKRQNLRIIILFLDHVVYKIGNMMQKHRQFMRAFGRLQIGAVMSGSSISGT